MKVEILKRKTGTRNRMTVVIRELSCGHEQVEINGGKSKEWTHAMCKECPARADGKPSTKREKDPARPVREPKPKVSDAEWLAGEGVTKPVEPEAQAEQPASDYFQKLDTSGWVP